MSTFALHQWLFERVAGTTTGVLSVPDPDDSNAPFPVSVIIPGIQTPDPSSLTDPNVELSIPLNARPTTTLGGDIVVEEGTLLAVVVCDESGADTLAGRKRVYAAAEYVAGRIIRTGERLGHVHRVFDDPSQTDADDPHWVVQFTATPEVRAQYRDETECRLPVAIMYRASRSA